MLDDWRTAPIDERLRTVLGFIEKLTLHPDDVHGADIARLRDVGLSDAAIEDAIHVCVLFNIYDRIADSLGFEIPGPAGFAFSAKMLLKYGYA